MSFAFELTFGPWSRSTENWTSTLNKFQQHPFCYFAPHSLWIAFFLRIPLCFGTRTNEPLSYFQIFLHTKMRVEHLSDILLHCLLFHRKCRWTSTWIEFFFSDVPPNLLSKILTLPQSCNVSNLGKMFHSNSVALHWYRHNLCSFEKLWSILSCPSKIRWPSDVDGSFQDTKQNLKRRRPSCAEDWWFFQHQLMTGVSMNVFPTKSFPNKRSHLARTSISWICRWQLFRKFFPMNTADSIITVKNIPQIIECFSIFYNIWNSFLSFSHLISHPVHEFILILLTIQILLHRFQWQSVEAMSLLEKQHRVSPILHEVAPRS